MTTEREQVAIDIRVKFDAVDGEAEDITIDGDPVRAIVQGMEATPEELLEGLHVERVAIWLVSGDLTPLPRPGKEVVFNGAAFEVESRVPSRRIDKLVLRRVW